MVRVYVILLKIVQILCMQGMVLLTLSVSVMKHEKLFFIALYVLAIGDGGHKPCVQTFAADQFNEDTAEERDTKSSFFNCWYLAIVFGSVSAVFLVSYLQVILVVLKVSLYICSLVFYFLKKETIMITISY